METVTSIATERQGSSKIPVVTFKEFSKIARQRSWTAQALADRFRGRIENPAEFFQRVLSGKSPANLIPYRSVIEIYLAEPEPLLPFDRLPNTKLGVSTNHEPRV